MGAVTVVKERSLVEDLPVWDVESSVIWGRDRRLTLLYELDAYHEPAMTDGEVNERAKQAEHAWNSLPEGVEYQFLVLADARAGRASVEAAWPPITVTDERTRILEEYRRARLQELLREDNSGGSLNLILKRRHFFAATLKPAAFWPTWKENPVGKAAELFGLLPSANFKARPADIYKRALGEVSTLARRVQSGLLQMGLTFHRCNDEEILSFLYQLLNPTASRCNDLRELPTRSFMNQYELLQRDEKQLAEIAPYAVNTSPMNVLVDDDVTTGWDYLRIGKYYAGIVSVKELPKEIQPGALTPLLSLGQHRFVVSYRLSKPHKAKVAGKLRRKGIISHGLRRQNMIVESDAKDVHATEISDQVDLALRRIYAQGQTVFGASLQILVYEETPERLDEACAEVVGALSKANGLRGYRETAGLFDAYRSMIPGGADFPRRKDLMTPEMVDLMPVWDCRPTKGMIPFRTSRNTCTWVDVFDKSINPNANVLIFGASGSGKSFLTNTLLVGQDIACAARGLPAPCTYIIDCGGSYNRYMGVRPDAVSRTFEGDNVPGIDPFQHGENDGPLDDHISSLCWLLLDLYKIDESDAERFARMQGVLEMALRRMYGGSHTRDFDGLDAALAADAGDDAATLRRSATRFRQGSLARLFQSDPRTSFGDNIRAVAFDFKGLQGRADSAAVALRLVVFEIRRRTARLHRRRVRSFVVFDESWMLLQEKSGQSSVVSAAGPFLAEYVRTARKDGGSVIALSQQLSDFMNCPWGPAIVSNSSTKFIGQAGGETEIMDLKSLLGLNDRQVEQVRSLRLVPREFVLIQGGGSGFARSDVVQATSDPLSLWTFGTSPDEKVRMAAIADEHPELSLFEQIQLLASGR